MPPTSPKITINGVVREFKPGQMILQVANEGGVDIPQYCYHDGLSIVASCRICLAEVWAPNPRNNNALEPLMGGKLMPTCQTPCSDGMVVYTDSPKSVANQKAVMEYLLINHPLDCPVCDQAGECTLQDFSYEYGRGVSRFEEQKVKQPKKDLGPHVYLYSDRCIMCTRCVRFTREVAGTSELLVTGRGNKEEIDVFPGIALDNELSANVVDLCPVGALLDKDFLFAQRVWFLKTAPSIDGITASGDNIFIEHNEGKVYRIKPRTNPAVNKWWITDEVRYGWKHVQSDARLRSPMRRMHGVLAESDYSRAYDDAVAGMEGAVRTGRRLMVMVSPMLSCEEAYLLGTLARAIDQRAVLAVGPVPMKGEDKTFPAGDANGFRMYAEKAPNARGVRRVLEAIAGGGSGGVLTYEEALRALGHGSGASDVGAVLLTGNYPSAWGTDDLINSLGGKFVTLIDTLGSSLVEASNVVLPGATWMEKSGCFENARHMLQHFDQAIPVIEMAKSEGQIALDLAAHLRHDGKGVSGRGAAHASARLFNAAETRRAMADAHGSLSVFLTDVAVPATGSLAEADMQVVEL
ncbi:MAG: molybdopterin-dependent oxidoreductase [Phycisphaeraceae bacterium]|nr:molybdopterin-dependent oxidoreductase [Phycisphaeraceae bacterium]